MALLTGGNVPNSGKFRVGAASVALSSAFLLSGCIAALPFAAYAVGSGAAMKAVGNSDAKGNMARATAQAIGHNVDPQSIKVSDAHIGKHEATWTADTPIGRFQCSDDDNVRGAAYCKSF